MISLWNVGVLLVFFLIGVPAVSLWCLNVAQMVGASGWAVFVYQGFGILALTYSVLTTEEWT